MNLRQQQHDQTRKAILDAVAHVMTELGPAGFSIQKVADRVGVTHRTVYNHFPTREALNDAFAVYVEEVLAAEGPAPEVGLSVDELVSVAEVGFPIFERHQHYVRAYVMLMMASRSPAKVMTTRTAALSRLLEREVAGLPRPAARLGSAGLRMFMSSAGWHLLTEHFGLSTSDAAALTTWAMKTMLAALRRGEFPKKEKRNA